MNHLHQQYKASSHFDHIPLLPSFLCISFNPQTLHGWDLLTCGYWEAIAEVGTYCILSTPGIITLCLYCYAMLVDVVWFERIHERCESYC